MGDGSRPSFFFGGLKGRVPPPRTRTQHPIDPQSTPMNRAAVVQLLRAQAPTLRERFGACSVSLFGSAARDEMRADSDIDILVEFAAPPSLDVYFGMKDHLESVLGRPVDLVTPGGLKPRARQHVERDLVHVA